MTTPTTPALPELPDKPAAWIWRWANGEEEVVFVDASRFEWDPEVDDCPTVVTSLYTADQLRARDAMWAAQVESLRLAVRPALIVARDGYIGQRATGLACQPLFTERAIALLDAAILAARTTKGA